MRVARRLNIVHTIHFSLVLCILFILNIFILREVAYRNLDAAFDGMALHLNHYINAEIASVKQAAVLTGSIVTEDPALADKEIQLLAKMNIDIETIELKSVNASIKKDGVSGNKAGDQFSVSLDSENVLLINMNNEWLSKLLIDFNMHSPYSILILDKENQIKYSNDSVKSVAEDLVTRKIFNDVMTSGQEHGQYVKNIRLFANNQKYLAHVNYNNSLGLFTVIYISNTQIFRFLRHYPIIVSVVFLIVLLILLSMVVRTNIRYTRPISNVAASLMNRSVQNVDNTDEMMLIQRTIDTLQNQVDFYKQNLEKSSAEVQKIEKDIQVAKSLQRNILPKNIVEIAQREEFLIYAESEAVYDLGGDFYDYFMIDTTRLMFVVADIAGKGIPASLFMIFTHTLLRTTAKPSLSSKEVINRLNNKLIENNISDLFVTMILGIMDVTTGEVEFSNAAHNVPVLIRENGEIEEVEEVHGIPLGIYANRDYGSSSVKLNVNDQIMFYTDGLMDTKDENGAQFSMEVLKYSLMGAWFKDPKEVVVKIQDDVKSFRGTADPVDDMTIMVLKYTNKISS